MLSEKKKRQKESTNAGCVLLTLACIVFVCILIGAGAANAPVSTAPTSTADIAKRAIEKYTDIKVLEAKKSNTQKGMLVIEYDLKPIIFVPNELIHHDKVMAIICALRRHGSIKQSYSLVGMGRFRDRHGKLVHRRSVVSNFNASTMNRIGCDRDRNARDVDWRRLATYYYSYPIPGGLKVDT